MTAQTSVSLRDAWEALATALSVQRVFLHHAEWVTCLPSTAEQCGLPAGFPPAALAVRPRPVPDAVVALLEPVGLDGWWRVARDVGTDGSGSPLSAAAGSVVAELFDGGDDDRVAGAVAVGGDLAAWWVGYFAVLRHRGIHHVSHAAVVDAVSTDTLRRAVQLVTIGIAGRVLRRAVSTDARYRLPYCRVVSAGVQVEPEIPGLLEDLTELRLVDLVGTALPWRGRFVKYAAGTGAGQVE